MHIFFSTVVRSAPIKLGGEIVKLDWEHKRLDATKPIYPSHPDVDDPNPRGNARGGRGIALMDDELVVASYHTLKFYSRDLVPIRDISHPLMVGIHELYVSGKRKIWVACTAIDTALEVDTQTGELIDEYWPREMPSFQRVMNIKPLQIDKSLDNRTGYLSRKHLEHSSHLHLNAIGSWNRDVYGLFNSFGVIANLSKQHIAVENPVLRGAHNLRIGDDGVAIVNDTYRATIRFFDLRSGKLQRSIDLRKFAWVRRLRILAKLRSLASRLRGKALAKEEARPLFLRGLDQVGNSLFVGISPASILRIDRETGHLLDTYCYSQDLRVCIHGLKASAS